MPIAERQKVKGVRIEKGALRTKAIDLARRRSPEAISGTFMREGEVSRLEIIPHDSKAFIKWCRRFLGLNYFEGFGLFHMQKMTDKLDLEPVAFANEIVEVSPNRYRAEWSLVLKANPEDLRVFNPVSGLRNMSYGPNLQVFYAHNKEQNSFIFTGRQAIDLNGFEYRLEEGKLQTLDRIIDTKHAADCGPLSLFAARLAKSK